MFGIELSSTNTKSSKSFLDERYSSIEHFLSFDKVSISRNDSFYIIFCIEGVHEFASPWFFDLVSVLLIDIVRHNNIKFFYEDQSLFHIDIFQKAEIRLSLLFESSGI